MNVPIDHRKWWLPVTIALVVALTGCVSSAREQSIRSYEDSLRDEADWLWHNMNHARTNFRPDPDRCVSKQFRHSPVTLTASQRQQDPQSARLVDHLDYAAVLIQQAHDEWDRFCRDESSATNTAAVMESRLVPAYQSMDQIRLAYLPRRPTPRPGGG